jgi:hypothetical protein
MGNEQDNQKDGDNSNANKDTNIDTNEVANSKEELALAKAEIEKHKRDLEDIRMEVMTPEYLEFLNSKGSPKKEDTKREDGKDSYAGLTPSQIAAKIKEELKADMKETIKREVLDDVNANKQADINKEVQSFAKKHEDFELYRPTMYGLALDPKNKDLNLQDLYEEAKAHIKRIHTPPSEKDKNMSRRSSNEKPNSNSSSFKNPDPSKGKSASEIANDAWDEVVGDKGFPTSM